MKSTLISLLYGLLIGLVVSPVETPRCQRPAAKHPREVAASVGCIDESPTVTPPASEEVCVRGSDPKPLPQSDRPVSLSNPPRSWLLPDTTWRAMADSRVKPDVNFERGEQYIGVRFVLPFGS